MATIPSSVEAKLQKLIDIEDIKTLMSKYCHGIDKKDEKTFMSIWAADGVYELPRGQTSGIEGILQLVHKVWREVPKCHHHITNPLIEVSGDRATARTDVIYYRQTADGELQLLSGMYAFEYTRISGEWKTKYLRFSSFDTISPAFKEAMER